MISHDKTMVLKENQILHVYQCQTTHDETLTTSYETTGRMWDVQIPNTCGLPLKPVTRLVVFYHQMWAHVNISHMYERCMNSRFGQRKYHLVLTMAPSLNKTFNQSINQSIPEVDV